ncbi:MAG: VCBS domain-containing protein [Limimaricola soesokkakensis]|uniref:VCBS domain-containing protein n=1 Tax=Limimaricola soesokkakensis TaxID=1343159 RepID=UPI004058F74D
MSGAVTGEATEDGTVVTLDALAAASDKDTGTTLSVVNVPTELPAGVSYDEATQSFSLDPSHAAYQSLAEGAKIPVTVTYAVSDGLAEPVTASVSWTVTGTNDAPVVSGAVTGEATEDGTVVTLDALAAASDKDTGTTLSVVNVPAELPAGVSYDEATQSFSLDPSHAAYQSLAEGAKIPVTVTYAVSDGLAEPVTASVSWTVTGTNDAPVATGEAFTGKEDTTVKGNVLGNDTDVDGDHLQVELVSWPDENFVSRENFSLDPDGTFTLTPKANVNDNTSGASFSFTYKVVDGKGGESEVVTATVNITPENDAPEIIRSTDPDYAEYSSYSPAAFQEVRENGEKPEGIGLSTSGSFHVRDIDSFAQDGDGIRTDLVSIGSEPVKTVFLPANDGAKAPDISEFVQIQNLSIQTADPGATVALVTYTFKVNDRALDFLGEGDKITLDYVVTIRDGHPTDEKFVTETVTLEIFGSDDKAVLTVVNPGDVQEADVASDQLITATGSITVDDVDQNDEISAKAQPLAGSPSYEGPGNLGDVVSAEDLAILTNSANLTFDTGLVTKGAGHPVDLGFRFETLSGVNLDALPEGGSLTLTFKVDVTVGFDHNDKPVVQTKDVTITIQGTNDAPVVSTPAQANGIVYEDGGVDPLGTDARGPQNVEVTGNALVDASASDVDYGDQLFVSGISRTEGNTTSSKSVSSDQPQLIMGAYGALSIAVDGTYTYRLYQAGDGYAALNALGHGDEVQETFTFTVSDGKEGGTADANLSFTVVGSNDRPVVTAKSVDVPEGSAPAIVQAEGLVTASDVDGDPTDFTFTVTGLTPYGEQMGDDEKSALLDKIKAEAFKGFSDGSWSFDLPSADVEFLNAGSSLEIAIKVEANDGQGQANSVGESSFTITINGQNDAPTVSPIELTLGEAALTPPVIFNLIEEGGASDPDGDPVTFVTESVGGSASISLANLLDDQGAGIDLQIPIETLIGAGVITVNANGSFEMDAQVASVLQDLLGNGDALQLAGNYDVKGGSDTPAGSDTTSGEFAIEIEGEGGAETHTAYTDDGGANIPDFLSPNELSDNDSGVAG